MRWKIAVAAMASVGDTMAPRTNAAGHDSPGTTACATTATPAVVKRTRPMESRPIGWRFALKSLIEVDQPPE
jgi:hypothetical protein